MFTRSIQRALDEWKTDPHRKPMLLRGARQVGKTTVVNQFGKSFDNYLYFNLESPEDLKFMEMNVPLDEKIRRMYAIKGYVRHQGSTLVFIDEIQNSPATIASLRYLYEQHNDIHVIAAGSLLKNVVDVHFSFPVGRVQYLPVRPCSFLEFASAVQPSSITAIYDETFSTAVHSQLMALFDQYTIVGGMPEAVQVYAERRDVLALDNIYETLLQAYRDDIEKYIRRKKLSEVARFLLEQGWLHAGETVTLGDFAGSGYRSTSVAEAFAMLQKAMLVELVYPTSSTAAPILTETRRQPKLIWLDTGLVNYVAGLRTELIGSQDILDVWRGRVAEHIVAQELLAISDKISQRRAYWSRNKGGDSAEVDFVWQLDSKVIPIEVKAGHNSRLRSLHSFLDNSDINFAVRVWSQPFSVDELYTSLGRKPFRLINLPFYMVGNIEAVVRKYI